MKIQTDTPPDSPPDTPADSSPPSSPVTSPDPLRYPDRFRGARWGGDPDDEDGSTWETHQDEGTFPAWV